MHTQPLSAAEEKLWRDFLEMMVTLPRALEGDLERRTGMLLATYRVLMHLSEAPGRQLRMTELAEMSSMSGSRITRIISDLEKDKVVSRARCPSDGRSTLATLTPAGLSRLEAAYPIHLESARRRFLDHLTAEQVAELASIMATLNAAADDEL